MLLKSIAVLALLVCGELLEIEDIFTFINMTVEINIPHYFY